MPRLLWIALVVFATSTASADPTKVALSIHGDSTKLGLRKAVVGAFDDDDGVRFVSAKKKARIVVKGAFDKAAHKVKFTVFTSGKKTGSFSIKVADASSAKFRKAVRKKMLAKIGVDGAATEVAADETKAEDTKAEETKPEAPNAEVKADETTAENTKTDETKTDDSNAEAKAEAPKPKHHAKHVAIADDNDDPMGGETDDASAHASFAPSARATSSQFAAIRVDLGASMIGRSLSFKTTGAEGTPSSYRARTTPGATVAAEMYPLAFGDRSRVTAGLGIGGELDQAISFRLQTSDGTMLPVTERHYAVGARFRIGFGHRATSPTVTLGAGYAARTFAIRHASAMQTGVPDVDYRAFEPSLVARVPVTMRVTAFAGGSAMLMRSAGEIADGALYGHAHVTGGTAALGVDIGLASHVGLRVSGEGTQVNLKFAGDGTMTGVYSARDRYYGGAATLAVSY